jgi:hypothetical protein
MRRLWRSGTVAALLLAAALTASAAAINLNSSKSNVYRLTYHANLLTEAQAKALLAELDRLGPMSEKKAKQWIAANFKRFGIDPALVKKTVVLPAGKAAPETVILLLADPADETAALAASVASGASTSLQ